MSVTVAPQVHPPRLALVGFATGVAIGLVALGAHAALGLGAPVAASDSYPYSSVLQAHFGRRSMWVLLALGGFAAGLRPGLRARWLALGSVATFPLALLVEVARDSTSHNLLPFEVAMWLAAALPAALGARAARLVAGRRAGA